MVHYVLGGSRKALLAMVNLGCIAVHTMNCRKDALARPDWLAFDLDPGSGKFSDAAKAGRILGSMLDELGLVSYPKTSGSRGLHVFVPLRRGADPGRGAHVRRLGRRDARGESASARHGRNVEGETARPRFRGRASQRVRADHRVTVFREAPAAGARFNAADWSEVDPKLDPSAFNLRNADRRLAGPNPWADFWKKRQGLPGR